MRNRLNSNEQTQLLAYAQFNPGAFSFLMKLITPVATQEQTAPIFEKLRNCKTLRGTNIYVMYSDLCDRDIDKVAKLCRNCPEDVLEDACNRQDYSGRELVEQYLK